MSHKLDGFIIVPDFISVEEEACLMKVLLDKDVPWLDKSHLRFSNTMQQEYGACISDSMEVIRDGESVALPPLCRRLAVRIQDEASKRKLASEVDLSSDTAAFLRVNYYNTLGGGYMHKHMDSHKCFGPVIACCSLLADASMTFYDTHGNSYGMARVHDIVEVPIPRRSLYFMTGPARFQWQHGIRKDQCQETRLSLTFRTIRADAPQKSVSVDNLAKKGKRETPLLRKPASAAKSDAKQPVLKRPSMYS